jgi:hypothetical protein
LVLVFLLRCVTCCPFAASVEWHVVLLQHLGDLGVRDSADHMLLVGGILCIL